MKPALQIPIQPKKTVIKELCNGCGTAKFQFIYVCPVIAKVYFSLFCDVT